MNLVKVTVGSLNYDAAPEVEVELKRLTVDSVDLKTKLDVKSSEVVKVQAKLDEATEKLTELGKVDHQVKIDEAVKARLVVERVAAKHLDSDTELDGMSTKDIKKACIIKCFPDAESKLDKAEDAYIDARFDSVLEIKIDSKDKGTGDHRKKMHTKIDSKKDEIKIDADDAREKMIENMKNPATKEA